MGRAPVAGGGSDWGPESEAERLDVEIITQPEVRVNMPSPKTPYANAPAPKAPSLNRGIMNQNQRKQLDYLDADMAPKAPVAPKPAAPAPAPRGPRPRPDYEGMEREAEQLRKRKPY